MRCLVSSTNFIGRSMADFLVSKGDEVILFGDPIEPRKLGPLASRVVLRNGDLAHFNEVLDVIRDAKPHAIFHLGQLFAKDSEADPWHAYRVNALGTYHVLEAARLFGISEIVYFSTLGTYAGSYAGVVGDHTPQRPTSMYAATKLIGELLGRAYHHRFGLDFRCIRFPPLFGPGADVDTFSSPINRIIQEPALGRPYRVPRRPSAPMHGIYLGDARRAFFELQRAPADRVKSRFYVLEGVSTTASGLAETVCAVLPDAQISFDEGQEEDAPGRSNAQLVRIDESLAKLEWGWNASYSLKEAVSDFIHEVRSDPERYR